MNQCRCPVLSLESNMRLIIYIFIFLKIVSGDTNPCLKQDFGHSSFVCVCNSTYCDTYGKIERKFLIIVAELPHKFLLLQLQVN